ncbi:hypothetical protein [Rhizobium sp. Rhizsp42]|uniref:hypothetical protein n=1 Tax=Rhizobium sp. Rhizsp42 TaxID=3243034 RepID=UPI0039B03F2A
MRISILALAIAAVMSNGSMANGSEPDPPMTKFHFLVLDGKPLPTTTLVDYTGSCGGSYTCANGTQLNCPSNARPAEFLSSNQCYCEYADTCK